MNGQVSCLKLPNFTFNLFFVPNPIVLLCLPVVKPVSSKTYKTQDLANFTKK